MTQNTLESPSSFEGLGIIPELLKQIEKEGFSVPTPIQRQAIPVAIAGEDILGIAQTGTGKTLAFGVPVIQRLSQQGGRGLIIVPTRELALQVDEMLFRFGRQLRLKTAVVIGGASISAQKHALRHQPDIIIGTPGRLQDHMQQGSLRLDDVRLLVLDEADRMLDMGFAPQIERIVRSIPRQRQTLLFSATMPDEILRLAHSYLKQPKRIEVAQSGTPAARIEQFVALVPQAAKRDALGKLLSEHRGTVLVFSRTKHGARKICQGVQSLGHPTAEIHSNRSLAQRREALEGFKSGKYRVLIATDIAARGIDVNGIELVVNYDLPANPDDYVHRIGRTGRAGKDGKAVSLVTPEERGSVRRIEKLIRKSLTVLSLGSLSVSITETPVETNQERTWRPSRPGASGFKKPFRPGGHAVRGSHRQQRSQHARSRSF